MRERERERERDVLKMLIFFLFFFGKLFLCFENGKLLLIPALLIKHYFISVGLGNCLV